MDPARTKIIACATVIEKVLPLALPQVQTQTPDFGLHLRPNELRSFLQYGVDASSSTAYLTKGWIEAGDSPFVEYEGSTL